MSGFCTFEFNCGLSPMRRKRYGVVFSSKESLSKGLLSDRIHSFLQSSAPPDELVILTHGFARAVLDDLLDNEEFLRRLPGRFLAQRPLPVTRAYFDAGGQLRAIGDDADAGLQVLTPLLIKAGLSSVFARRKGLLPTSPVHHFVKPSGKHTAQFIRTAQVLVDGGEVDFIASALLSHLKSATEYIYCDSASISVLAYALVKLKKCHDANFVCPVIESFSSYDHVNDYGFLNPSESLFLISASTSGDLARFLMTNKSIPANRIVTIFFLGKHVGGDHVLLDLTHHKTSNPEGYAIIEAYPPDECPYCLAGSCRIALLGDQFLPQSPNVETILLGTSDAPSWISPFMSKVIGKGIIRCHHGTGLRGRIHEQFLYIAPALNRRAGGNTSLGKNIRKAIAQSVPASLTRIIYIDDAISRKLALFIRRQFKQRRQRSVDLELTNSREITREPECFRDKKGTVLVVAGCIVTGRSLMELSQVLRNIQENGSIVFFVALSRCETETVFREIRTNITFTRDRSRNFGFHCFERINIPDSTSFRQSIWTEEELFLKSLRARCSGQKFFPLEVVDRRIALLGASAFSGEGLEEKLFWPDSDGVDLRLRPNFAFFDFPHDARTVTQAEVFFVMASLLHHLRCKSGARRSLIQYEHDRRLVAPNSFYRLNDGIVQAALLRAARKAEIDYRVSESESAAMAEVVNSVFNAWTRSRGEAAVEFLVMLAMGQLQLTEVDKIDAVTRFKKQLKRGTFPYFVANYVLETV